MQSEMEDDVGPEMHKEAMMPTPTTPFGPGMTDAVVGQQQQLLHQEFTLRWDPHDARLADTMIRAWEQKLFLDVTLASGQQTVGAHKMVLCACSSLFETLLTSPAAQLNPHPLFFFNDVDFDDLYALVEFMYRGSMTVTRLALPSIIQAARTLRIRGLSHVTDVDESVDSPPESSGGSEPPANTTTASGPILPSVVNSLGTPGGPDKPPSRKRRKQAAAAGPVIKPQEEEDIGIPPETAALIDPVAMESMTEHQKKVAAFLSAMAISKNAGAAGLVPKTPTSAGPSPLRPRLVWDPAHIVYLENWYKTETRYPTSSQSQAYAEQLSVVPHSDTSGKSKRMVVTAQNVSHWFQNRRRKDNHPEIEEKRVKRGQKRAMKNGNNNNNTTIKSTGPLDLTLQQDLQPSDMKQPPPDSDDDEDNLCIADDYHQRHHNNGLSSDAENETAPY